MRIISLLASATEMVAALGCLDQMVGRSHECDYPPEVLALPMVSTVQIDINTSSAQIDAQVKQLAQEKREPEDPALKALSILQSTLINCRNCALMLSSHKHNARFVLSVNAM